MQTFSFADKYTEVGVIEESEYQRLVEAQDKATGERYLCRQISLEEYTTKVYELCKTDITLSTQVVSPFFATVHEATYEAKSRKVFVLMEDFPMGTLNDYLYSLPDDEFLPEATCWSLLACLVEAICQLHEPSRMKDIEHRFTRAIIHRYIMPRRIFMVSETRCKLADIGWSRDLLSMEGKMGYIQGTLQYYAPELIVNESYGREVDIFALGCTMYEIMMKRVLVEDDPEEPLKALEKIRLPLIITTYSKKLVNLVSSMLNPDPKKRPTAFEMRTIPEIANVLKAEFSI